MDTVFEEDIFKYIFLNEYEFLLNFTEVSS